MTISLFIIGYNFSLCPVIYPAIANLLLVEGAQVGNSVGDSAGGKKLCYPNVTVHITGKALKSGNVSYWI